MTQHTSRLLGFAAALVITLISSVSAAAQAAPNVATCLTDPMSAHPPGSSAATYDPYAKVRHPYDRPSRSEPTPTALTGVKLVTPREAKCIIDALKDGVTVISAYRSAAPDAAVAGVNLPRTNLRQWIGLREGAFFDAVHLQAIDEELTRIMANLTGGNKRQPVLVYCDDHYDYECFFAANRISRAGHQNLFWMRSGRRGWKAAGYASSMVPSPSEEAQQAAQNLWTACLDKGLQSSTGDASPAARDLWFAGCKKEELQWSQSARDVDHPKALEAANESAKVSLGLFFNNFQKKRADDLKTKTSLGDQGIGIPDGEKMDGYEFCYVRLVTSKGFEVFASPAFLSALRRMDTTALASHNQLYGAIIAGRSHRSELYAAKVYEETGRNSHNLEGCWFETNRNRLEVKRQALIEELRTVSRDSRDRYPLRELAF